MAHLIPVFYTPDALQYISKFRQVVYQYPCLRVRGSRPKKRSSNAEKERVRLKEQLRREKERMLLMELSRYYWLEGNDGVRKGGRYKEVWTAPALLERGKPCLSIRCKVTFRSPALDSVLEDLRDIDPTPP